MATYLPTGMMPGLLSPEQEAVVKEQALNNALLNFGLQALAGSTAVGYKPRIAQVVGQAGQAGLQAYQGTFDQQLQNMLRQQQVQDLQRKRAQETQRQQQLQSFIETLPEDQRARFQAFPEQAAEAMFREAKPAPGVVGEYNAAVQSGLITPDTTLEQYVAMKKPPGTTVNVPVNLSTEKKFGEAFATQIAQEDVKLRESAMAAPSQLDTIQQTRNLLEQGKVFTGKFADQKLALAAAGQALGVTGADTNEIVANTERLFANRAKATLDNVRNSGLGAGQGFTDRDREFLEKAVLGNINFTAESLKRQLEIEEKVARGAVAKWNNRFKQLPKSTVEATGITPVELTPRPTQPQTGIKRFNPATGRVE